MIPVIKNLLVRITGTITTKLESKQVRSGDVVLMRFASENEYRAMLPLGVFVEHEGPPPAIIMSKQPPAAVEQDVVQSPPVVPPVVVLQKSRPCKNCRTMLILTTDATIPDKQILFCPNCNSEEDLVVEETVTAETVTAEAEPAKTVRTRCPICNAVKKKDEEICKICAAKRQEVQALEGSE